MNKLKLMCVLAHPDDESLGVGGTLARYAAAGVQTYLVTATRGERGWSDAKGEYPGSIALGKMRKAELHRAASKLGICEVNFLDYLDGELDQADAQEVIAKIVTHLRRVKPDVVITFDPFGSYGHPDHIAICQLTTAAIIKAGDSTYLDHGMLAPHQVSKLYYMVTTSPMLATYQEVFGDLVMRVDGVERRGVGWPEWAVTTHIDIADYQEQILDAILCHQSQLPDNVLLKSLSQEQKQALWRVEMYYRVFDLTNNNLQIETDLFAGLSEGSLTE